jgi:hypothetical protein
VCKWRSMRDWETALAGSPVGRPQPGQAVESSGIWLPQRLQNMVGKDGCKVWNDWLRHPQIRRKSAEVPRGTAWRRPSGAEEGAWGPVPSLRDSRSLPTLPGTCVPGFHMTPRCGWNLVDFAPPLSLKSNSHAHTEAPFIHYGCGVVEAASFSKLAAGCWLRWYMA